MAQWVKELDAGRYMPDYPSLDAKTHVRWEGKLTPQSCPDLLSHIVACFCTHIHVTPNTFLNIILARHIGEHL